MYVVIACVVRLSTCTCICLERACMELHVRSIRLSTNLLPLEWCNNFELEKVWRWLSLLHLICGVIGESYPPLSIGADAQHLRPLPCITSNPLPFVFLTKCGWRRPQTQGRPTKVGGSPRGGLSPSKNWSRNLFVKIPRHQDLLFSLLISLRRRGSVVFLLILRLLCVALVGFCVCSWVDSLGCN